ncbi:MAG: hypothetical protein K2X35_17800 [Bryobacteraceae bacterium]|nr:hypothetical protein [Bryobacteraceae bacterium]
MRLGVFMLAVGALLPAQELSEETLLLARIRAHAVRTLQRQPNYTCLETIERSRRKAGTKRYELLDSLRMEVALVEGREMFAWPGEKNFEEKPLSDLVTNGAMGNGNFALHAKALFQGNAPVFTHRGEVMEAGRSLVRYDFKVPQMLSGYNIRVGANRAVVGYHGSFWADSRTLDLVRLVVHADDIPPSLPLAAASDLMSYAPVTIGGKDFLLPNWSELTLTDLAGNESRNRVAFGECRQYAGDSVLSFEDPAAGQSTAPADVRVRIPDGVDVILALDQDLDLEQASIGDPVRARLEQPIREGRAVLFAKGAGVTGRLMRMERHRNFLLVAIEFGSVREGNRTAELRLELERTGNEFAPGGGARESIWSNSGMGEFLAAEKAKGAFPLIQTSRMKRGFYFKLRSLPAEGAPGGMAQHRERQ